MPIVLFAEGGSDTDMISVSAPQIDTFHRFARPSDLVPLVGIVSGRCFAGNAVLLGCCDVVIATAICRCMVSTLELFAVTDRNGFDRTVNIKGRWSASQ